MSIKWLKESLLLTKTILIVLPLMKILKFGQNNIVKQTVKLKKKFVTVCVIIKERLL